MTLPLLLATVTLLYAGYNLLIKASGTHVPLGATTTIVATIWLQAAALMTSLVFAGFLVLRGGHVFQLSTPTYLWAAAAGLSIGGAEIAYFYLFGGLGGGRAMAANVAIPIVVSGTIVITLAVAYLALGEPLSWRQLIGCLCILIGIAFLFFGRADGTG
jgi:drug/metabolite transporter (DMT)-like permease